MQYFGAHLSISGGFSEALKRASDIGGNCLQIFSSPPRNWSLKEPSQSEIDLFLKTKRELKIGPVYFHTTYLVNLAGENGIDQKSVEFLIKELNLAGKLGVIGSIVHLGSFKGNKTELAYKKLIKNIREILAKTPRQTFFIIENAGNRKIGASLDEIAEIVKDLGSARVKVCLDTCHLWASGYDITDTKKLNNFLSEFDKKIGLQKIELWHANDSRDEFGSFRDRHENIGQGALSLKAFEVLVNQSKINDRPFIIETPGFDGNGPDQKNLEILKGLTKNTL